MINLGNHASEFSGKRQTPQSMIICQPSDKQTEEVNIKSQSFVMGKEKAIADWLSH